MEGKEKAFNIIYPILAVAAVGCAVKCFIDGRLGAGIALCVLAVAVGLWAAFRKKLIKEDE
ncbi:MAG: hypothetical protein J6U75_02970 [Clostridia bacterium]|nr:hypothetical protein [Clostridia bacterium]